MAHTLRSFGAVLSRTRTTTWGPATAKTTIAIDCDVLTRYRVSLDPEKRKREQHGLMRRLYREPERRVAGPYADSEG